MNETPTIVLPEPTRDQREYLQRIVDATGHYDPSVVIGGPSGPGQKLARTIDEWENDPEASGPWSENLSPSDVALILKALRNLR